nr:hypothetical protein [Leifsonia psychrotolerans]
MSAWAKAGSLVAGVGIVAALVLVPQPATAEPAPSTGPTAGGTTVSGTLPAGLQFSRVVSGGSSAYGLGADDRWYAWGDNTFYQLGDGSGAHQSNPVRVRTPATVTDPHFTYTTLAVGNGFMFGLGSDAQWYAWGSNSSGQLGIGSNGQPLFPTKVKTPATVTDPDFTFTKITIGVDSAFGLGTDGHWYAWGYNYQGKLGDGTEANQSAPALVRTPGADASFRFTDIIGGNDSTFGLGSDGRWYAWGNNNLGQLGDGSVTKRTTPVRVRTPTGVTDPAFTFTKITPNGLSIFGLGSNGLWYSWGYNGVGTLGDGSVVSRSSPVRVRTPGTVTDPAFTFVDIFGNSNVTFGLGSNGLWYAWGVNTYGQLGDGSTTNRSVPVQVSAPGTVTDPDFTFTKVITSFSSTFGLGSDGTWYSWGYNNIGTLGDGSKTSRSIAVRVSAPATVSDPAFAFTEIAVGAYFAMGLGSDGQRYAWGLNSNSQLGDGSKVDRSTAVQSPQPAKVTAVSFAGTAGTGLSQVSGQWSVVTPAAPTGVCGPVDVVVTRTELGKTLKTIVAGGFVYGAAPLVTVQPVSASIVSGGSYSASVQASGDPTPTIEWFQQNGDGTWSPTAVATGATLTAVGLTAATSYRAAVTNCLTGADAVFSDTVTATVQAAPSLSGGTATIKAGARQMFAANPVTTGSIRSAEITSAPDSGQATVTIGGDVTFTAAPADATTPTSTVAFTVTMTDNLGQTGQAHYTVTVTNQAVTVETGSLLPGKKQSVTGTGFAPGESVTAVMDADAGSGSVTLGTADADAHGAVTFEWVIPAGTSAGTHAVTLTGATSGQARVEFIVSSPTPTSTPTPTPSPVSTPTPMPSRPETPLAATGTASLGGGLLGATLLVAAGVLALGIRSRRRSQR